MKGTNQESTHESKVDFNRSRTNFTLGEKLRKLQLLNRFGPIFTEAKSVAADLNKRLYDVIWSDPLQAVRVVLDRKTDRRGHATEEVKSIECNHPGVIPFSVYAKLAGLPSRDPEAELLLPLPFALGDCPTTSVADTVNFVVDDGHDPLGPGRSWYPLRPKYAALVIGVGPILRCYIPVSEVNSFQVVAAGSNTTFSKALVRSDDGYKAVERMDLLGHYQDGFRGWDFLRPGEHYPQRWWHFFSEDAQPLRKQNPSRLDNREGDALIRRLHEDTPPNKDLQPTSYHKHLVNKPVTCEGIE